MHSKLRTVIYQTYQQLVVKTVCNCTLFCKQLYSRLHKSKFRLFSSLYWWYICKRGSACKHGSRQTWQHVNKVSTDSTNVYRPHCFSFYFNVSFDFVLRTKYFSIIFTVCCTQTICDWLGSRGLLCRKNANQFQPGALTDLKQRHPVENSQGILRVCANQFEPSAPTDSGRRHLVENGWGLINFKSEHGVRV